MDNDITLIFGKFTGKKLSEISDRSYLVWLADQDIRKQPEAHAAARAFLQAHPAMETEKPRRAQQPVPAPRTYHDASKLGWMAGKGYGNARATMLAARDQDGFLSVIDEDDDEDRDRLLFVQEDGSITDAVGHFYAMSYTQVEAVLDRYPGIDRGSYLEQVVEREETEADEARRTVEMKSLNGKHTIRLCVWDALHIDVTIDGRERGAYVYRELTEEERRDPTWQQAVALLEPDEDDPWGQPGSRNLGLTPERKALIEQKIQDVACRRDPEK